MAHDSPTGLNLERFTTTKPTSRLHGREHGNKAGTFFTMKSPYVGESAVQALKREAHFVEVFAHSNS
jgi:hypothetical protein